MTTRHPYRAVGMVLAVMALSASVAGMIGQDSDGPLGGLPEWLGVVSWFAFLASVLAILVLSAYWPAPTCATAASAPGSTTHVSLRAAERWKK
jgi:hypothetical protein